jgi:hypothetical protein
LHPVLENLPRLRFSGRVLEDRAFEQQRVDLSDESPEDGSAALQTLKAPMEYRFAASIKGED